MRVAFSTCALVVAACGRLGFDSVEQAADAPPGDTSNTSLCPSDTTAIQEGSMVCIERAQRGSDTWTNATTTCATVLRRLCTDQEWLTACLKAPGLTDMTGDDYEWVAEQAAGIGQKRGASGCDDMSAHEIFVDPYGFRCCTDL